MSKSVTILGSTGSIGLSTMKALRELGDEFQLFGLACNNNLSIVAEQIEEFSPKIVSIASDEAAQSMEFEELKKRFPGVAFKTRESGIEEMVCNKVDILVSAIVGAAGLKPTLSAVPYVKRIALANKETLVMAGDIFMRQVQENSVELIPVDSEHSAIFSLIENAKSSELRRIILTASGGSFRDRPVEELAAVTPEEALAHPTWEMGQKITIDSATMMNKGLEVIEAHHLFGFSYDDIDVIIHPESIVHSMVESYDGALFAHMSVADMALPIFNALVYPEKRKHSLGRLTFDMIRQLNFLPLDNIKYPAVEMSYQAGRAGGTMPAVLNASNEVAVSAFLKHQISYTDIVTIVGSVVRDHIKIDNPDVDAIVNADSTARITAKRLIKELS